MKKMIPKFLFLNLFFLAILLCSSVYAQKKVTGRVTDAADGSTIPGVNIVVKGTTVGTLTDIDGNFMLNVPAGRNEISISMIGYATVNQIVGDQTVINVALVASVQAIDEVVVTGYGTQIRSKVTSSIAKIDMKLLETGVHSNPAQALSGTVPGLRVVTSTGKPGAVPDIILRGGTNFDGTGSPLIIMDGQIRGSLSDINPEEIESMEVLKDASATAIYGARASNGVILITSKKGKAGVATVTVKVKHGTNYLNTPYEFVDAENYIKWARLGAEQAIKNGTLAASNVAGVGPRGTGNVYKDASGNIIDGNYDSRAIWSVMRLDATNQELLSQPGWKQMKDPIKTAANGNYDPNGTISDLIYRNFNYGDYGLHKTAQTQDYNISFTGGNDRGKYFANLGYYDEGGLSLETFYKRLNFAFNGDYKIKDWLTSESGIQFAMAKWKDESLQNGETNYWARMLSAPPTMRGTNAKGELLLGRDNSDGNPAFNADKYFRGNQSDKFTMNQAFKVDIMKGLYVKASGIVMYDESFKESFNKDFRTGIMNLTNVNTGWNRTRSSSANFDRTIRQTYNTIANYQAKFLEKHSITAMAGFEYFELNRYGVSASGSNAPTDDFRDLKITVNSADLQTRSTDSWHVKERIISQFGRVNYDYSDKYLLSFVVRRDGYSRLVGDNQYGVFPAFSGGWIISKEDFMQSTKNWLSYLKLRSGWGKNGNIGQIGKDNEGRDMEQGTYEVQGAYGSQTAYNGAIGFLQTGIATPKLKWEKTNTVELGIDMGFFDNRIYATLAYYNRITSDKIAKVILPTSSGIIDVRTNNGSMKNTGFEVEVTGKIIQKKDLKWQVSGNASWNKNIVLKLPYNGNQNNRQGGQQIYDPATKKTVWVGGLQEGQEWGSIYGFVSEGIIRNADDLANYNKVDIAAGQAWYTGSAGKRVASQKIMTARGLNLAGGWIPTQMGDVRWKDIDQNDTIDTRDMVSLGRVIPRLTGGFTTTLSYKRFTFAARVDFGIGHIQQDFMHLWALSCAQGEFAPTTAVYDTWTVDNPNASLPRYVWADQLNAKNYDRPSSMFWKKSDYLAFREVSLSYSVPTALLKKAKIGGLVLTATGQNLGYLSNKMLNFPERTGNQNGAYIIPTQLIFGAEITF